MANEYFCNERKLYDYLMHSGYIVISDLEEEDVQLLDDDDILVGYVFEVEKNGFEFEVQFDILDSIENEYAMWQKDNSEDWFLGEVRV